MGEKSHKQHNLIILTSLQFQNNYNCPLSRASDISRKKSKISQDFHGQIRGKIGLFRGKKVKIRGKIGRFSGIFVGEKSNFEGFSGANSMKNRPISQEILGGNFTNKQSVKNSQFCWIFFGKFH